MTMSHGFNDRVTIYLAIESVEWAPSVLTDRLGVRPDREWTAGDVRGRTGKLWDSHGWVVEATVNSEDNGGRSASELIPIAISKFENKVKPIADAASSLGDSAQRYTVLAILAEEVPGIELSNSFLRLLTDLGGTFQIDLSAQLSVSSVADSVPT
jgi:Domain of unknown function (DUF4279)